MAADGITEEFFLGAETLEAVGFGQRDGREAREVGRGKKPRLAGRGNIELRTLNIELRTLNFEL